MERLDAESEPRQTNLSSDTKRVSPMAVTPSKNYKRQEREQRKIEKRMARDAAKAEKLQAQRVAEENAAKEATLKSEEEAKKTEEEDFEAELEAERLSQAGS
ncbi:MAG: hypothetical protein P8R42_12845 [Candidatus Binatia bacterium]|nr:hypothetical protein [Candidatus Binatia bacterium]